MSFFSTAQLPSVKPMPGITRSSVYLDNVMLTFFDFEPGAVVPEHQHPHEQITLVLAGEMVFTLGGETRTLHPGEGVTIPPNVRHRAVIKETFTRAVDAWHPIREDYK
jgi:quercetin dioxygenase-like cupin family protein